MKVTRNFEIMLERDCCDCDLNSLYGKENKEICSEVMKKITGFFCKSEHGKFSFKISKTWEHCSLDNTKICDTIRYKVNHDYLYEVKFISADFFIIQFITDDWDQSELNKLSFNYISQRNGNINDFEIEV